MFASMTTLLLALASTTFAAPTQTLQERGMYDWSPLLSEFYTIVGKHIANMRDEPNFPDPPPCDLSQARIPTAPTPLPSPGDGQVLRHVAVGRGTQNYTCDSALASEEPSPIGAKASLYNASCIASLWPDMLALLPKIALQFPVPDPEDSLIPANIGLSGHHFFSNKTTPIFDLNTDPQRDYGYLVGQKIDSTPAPDDAPVGPGGIGDGAVAWLYLTSVDGTTDGLETVYRVDTAGGSPPKTCENMPAEFTVEYSALYWFYGAGI